MLLHVSVFAQTCDSKIYIPYFYLQAIVDDIKDNKPHKEIIQDIKELSVKNSIPEHEVIGIVS